MFDPMQVVVDALYIYPVKACAGLRVPSLQFSDQGLINGDRQWVVVNGEAEVVWQGSHPRLALVHPHTAPGFLHLSGPDGQTLTIPNPPPRDAPCQVKIWNSSLQRNEIFDGIDAGDAAAALLKHITGAALRLVRLDATAWVRGTVNPCHIASNASMAELNAAQATQGLSAVEIGRFRPNIVISSGQSELDPFVEEYCTQLRWQDAGRTALLAVQAEPCIRCIVPNVDLRTAAKGDQPLETVTRLSADRHPGQPAYFGIYARPQQAATLQQGAQLELVLNF